MTLPTRPFGRTGLAITTVGAGTWAMGGGGWAFSWGEQDDASSIAAIRRALAGGVNWIDTAPVYGLGHAEEVVRQALEGIPASERPLVFTKCGLRWSEEDRMRPAVRTLDPASIREEVEQSLRRLGVEVIDLLQFHWPDETGVPVEDSWGEMARLVESGKVRFVGVCNFSPDLLERCERIRHVDSLQPPFSMITRDAAAGPIPWAAAHGTGVIVYSPMKAGLLTDAFSQDRVAAMDPGDWRRQNPEFQEPALSRNIALRDALRPIAERHGTTVAAVAIAWALAWPGVTAAIVGARSPEQVEGWLGAALLELSPADLAEMEQAIVTTGAGSGPVRPHPQR
jgi:aryl-alcohol dehydrogenase-like predicted oxidoreductase